MSQETPPDYFMNSAKNITQVTISHLIGPA